MPAEIQLNAHIEASVKRPKTMAAGICIRCSSLKRLRSNKICKTMKIRCMSIVYCPTVPIVNGPIWKCPARETTYGGHDIGAVPRSDLMDRATPIATKMSPKVPVA